MSHLRPLSPPRALTRNLYYLYYSSNCDSSFLRLPIPMTVNTQGQLVPLANPRGVVMLPRGMPFRGGVPMMQMAGQMAGRGPVQGYPPHLMHVCSTYPLRGMEGADYRCPTSPV